MAERFIRNSKVEVAPMKGEAVLFNPANSKFCVLNITAAFIWQSLERPQTVEEIVAGVAAHFINVRAEQVEVDVRRVLEELRGIECVVSPD